MSYIVACECGHRMTLADDAIGQERQCDSCGRTFRVTEENAQPITPPVRVSRSELRCATCGREVSPYAEFCGSCGTLFKEPKGTVAEQTAGARAGALSLAIISLVMGGVAWYVFMTPYFLACTAAGLAFGGVAHRLSRGGENLVTARRVATVGTTLSALLVLLYILILVAAINRVSLPRSVVRVLSKGFGRAYPARPSVRCPNNLKQMGLVFKMYANESNGMFPPIDDWHGNLTFEKDGVYPEYLTDLKILQCPDASPNAPVMLSGSVSDHSYVYLGWAVGSETEGLALLDAYDGLDPAQVDKDLSVPAGTGTAGSAKVHRIREGFERLFITDVNNPAYAAVVQSTIPVMWDRPENHSSQGGAYVFVHGRARRVRRVSRQVPHGHRVSVEITQDFC